jgi:hypothetical protein
VEVKEEVLPLPTRPYARLISNARGDSAVLQGLIAGDGCVTLFFVIDGGEVRMAAVCKEKGSELSDLWKRNCPLVGPETGLRKPNLHAAGEGRGLRRSAYVWCSMVCRSFAWVPPLA